MKRILLILVGLAVLFLAARALYRAFVSEETRIVWLLQERTAAFNDTSIRSCMEGFSPDYRETKLDLTKQELQGALLYVFTQRRHPSTRRFLFEAKIPDEHLDVDLIDGETNAKVAFRLQLYERTNQSSVLVWEMRVDAELAKRDGAWKIRSSRHETLSGTRPGR